MGKHMAPLFGAARYVCNKGNWDVSQLKLQKILYLAHMVYMGRTGKRLFEGPFQAWDYGPVQPYLYRKVSAFGARPIPDIFAGAGELREDEQEILDEACRHLLHKTPGQLVENTHTPHGAWAKNYVPGVRGITIPDGDILDEYRRRVDRASRKRPLPSSSRRVTT